MLGTCRQGHTLFECNSVVVVHSRSGKAYRRCLRCQAIRQQKYRLRKNNKIPVDTARASRHLATHENDDLNARRLPRLAPTGVEPVELHAR